MKRYKHIPTGLIFNFREKKDTGMTIMLEAVNENGEPNGVEIFSGFVRGHKTKDWEEVKEKEWEITAFEKCGEIYPNKKSENYLLRGDFVIYSVKRLSDGEEFKIGDYNGFGIIESFKVIENELIAFTEKHKSQTGYRDWKKHTKLFTTEDGVDIYEGATVYTVEDDLGQVCTQFCSKKFEKHGRFVEHWYKGDKYFYTQKAAEEYILMNKPYLSINDIMTNGGGLITHTVESLKEYVKKHKIIGE